MKDAVDAFLIRTFQLTIWWESFVHARARARCELCGLFIRWFDGVNGSIFNASLIGRSLVVFICRWWLTHRVTVWSMTNYRHKQGTANGKKMLKNLNVINNSQQVEMRLPSCAKYRRFGQLHAITYSRLSKILKTVLECIQWSLIKEWFGWAT